MNAGIVFKITGCQYYKMNVALWICPDWMWTVAKFH